MYFVFRRNDGYVGSIWSETALSGRQRLAGYANRAGERVDYEILLETDEWDVANLALIAHRIPCTHRGCANPREEGCGELCSTCWTGGCTHTLTAA